MESRNPFFSYKFADQEFVELVYYMLSKQGITPFYWPIHGRAGSLSGLLADQIDACDSMVAFLGANGGGTQEKEISYFLGNQNGRPFVPVRLVETLPSGSRFAVAGMGVTPAEGIDHDAARKLAETIIPLLGLTWAPDDGLPNCYIVDNEKKFLEDLGKEDPALLFKLRTECGWKGWPKVEQTVFEEVKEVENPITDNSIGTLSDESPRVLLDARTNALTKEINELTLPEARPRKHLLYPRVEGGELGVGILVSGGIAPGINAVIDGIVSRHGLYSEKQNAAGREHSLKILGFREGFRALLKAEQQVWVGPAVHAQRPDLRVVLASDGAPTQWESLREIAARVLGDKPRTELLDFFHGASRLGTAAKAIWGTTEEATVTGEHWKTVLREKTRGASLVLKSLEYQRSVADAATAKELTKSINYLARHKKESRLGYAAAKKLGLPIGTGVTEAAAKTLVSVRMKRSGARYSDHGGYTILTLRAAILSERFEALSAEIESTYSLAVAA